MRVTEDMVRSALAWPRNYGEIHNFRSVMPRGRRWEIELPGEVSVSGSEAGFMTHNIMTGEPLPQGVVPRVFVLTSREALAFSYGCAAGGVHDRTEFAREKWGWGK